MLTLVYAFFPFISAVIFAMLTILLSRHDGPGTGGIAAVGGGLSLPSLLVFLLGASALFLIIFYLLQRRHAKS